MSETPTLARFTAGYRQTGVSPDGLPVYEETIRILLSRPPYLEVDRVATDSDQVDYPHPWMLFQQEQKGRKMTGKDGYPLVMWPAANAAEIRMCADREIYTVEQLAKLTARGSAQDSVPAHILELAKRAKRMIELSKETGKHEARITELEGMIGVLREQNNELKATNEGLTLKLSMMLARPAA